MTSKKIVLSPENHSPPPSAEIIATNVDLHTEILLRVPATSLIKFKSVSKRWLSLISDSRFAQNHAHRNPSPPHSGLYFYTTSNRSLSSNDPITRVSVRDNPRTSLPNLSFLCDSSPRFETRVLHSSNGLMLCSTFDTNNCIDDKNYVICNLTTQKFVVLPKPVLSEFHLKFRSYLVFDPKKSPNYKVVVVSLAYDLNTYKLDVYSSESASWKSPILTLKNQAGKHGAVWNGELILMSCDLGSKLESCANHDHLYMRFDVDAEKLTTTRVPYLDSKISERIEYFGECTGHLLLIHCSWYDPMEFKEQMKMISLWWYTIGAKSYSTISSARRGRNHAQPKSLSSPLRPPLLHHPLHHHNRSLPLNDQIPRVSVHDDPRTTLPDFSFLGDHSGSGSETTVNHSSNGLTLCSNFDNFYYPDEKYYVICNLTTQKFAVLPTPVVSKFNFKIGSFLVFDPKKSPYYKVVVVSFDSNASQLDVYSSESGSWKSPPILAPKVHEHSFVHGAVWNGELILMSCGRDLEFDCAKHDHLYIRFDIDAEKLTTARVPCLDSNFSQRIEYFGECNGHLILIQSSWFDPKEFKVLEMRDGENYFRWNVKYVVDLTPLGLTNRNCGTFSVMSVMNVEANENDLAVVVYDRDKVIQYNIECKTWKVLCDLSGGDFFARVCPLYEGTFRFIGSLTPV
ncbi:hypothetical protein RHSIM_Rhsim10G0184900 [Rhododendron simsii]|uniref:F-box domain-containing protein n=1 Tax=Rhododendron simsii TaxID=118357 RepID=A0A834GCI9_RHOSS|nr:hypothetical protein RHSIM_Rhsim10G0184900 [Rhododendron simsii]